MPDNSRLDFDKVVREMRGLSELLVDLSHPKADKEDEDQVSALKTRELTVDGYDVVLNFGKSQKEGVAMECLQCLGQNSHFLPFALVVKLATKFLGNEHLCFVDLFVNNKKVYIFTRNADDQGKTIYPEQDVLEEMEFEGLRFGYLNPQSVNFY